MFKFIRQFKTREPDLLGTQLSKLESNIDAESRSLRSDLLDAFSTIVLGPTVAPFTATLKHGQLLNCFSSPSTVLVTLEAPDGSNVGRMAALIKGAATVNVTVAQPGKNRVQGLVNLASTIVLAGGGLHLFLSDGANWWTSS